MTVTVKAIDALLPQTQCGECGYPGCMPYAEALAQGHAPIDRCPPGGVATVKALAELLRNDASPYLQAAEANTRAPSQAVIREAECIGCTKCIQACPVDAILGSAKVMHAVISTDCTGCGLCVEPCPVDCIELQELDAPQYDKNRARQQFQQRQVRLLREQNEQQQAYRARRRLSAENEADQRDMQVKQDYILQALARVQSKGKHE
ncbi:RnfABCDGE type electron transport complex subunit B [Legionella sp. CNM-4043-24]|uniref:RnfABCDGE type electron transport complex subunit B n=1 Tax=Legionella sp. CNM-4043-24 TaxID=3421646 RepID=UPI00403ACAFD